MGTTTTAARIIAARLYEAGCRYAFGIPGGEVLTMIEALNWAGIRFVLTKHENNAGFMAEGVYQRTGAPGILVATLGPGAANAVNVTANAEQDRVPLIVLTGCVDEAEALTYTHQVFDHQALFRPITKASFRVGDGGIEVLADKAVALALDDRPGPVHIDLPIAATEVAREPERPVRRARPAPAAPAPGPALEEARQWLAEAERPLLVAGLDVMNHGAADTVATFARDFQIPVVTTYKAKGVLPEDEALALGGAGLSPTADAELLPLVQSADLILLAGYDPIEMRTGWREAWSPSAQRVVEIAASANDHYMHQASLSFIADIGAGIEALREGVAPRPTWPDGAPGRVKQTLAGAFGQNEDWGPAAITTTVRGALPRDAIATVDSGAHRILLSQVWEAYEPRTLLQSTGLCTMGCALPLAIGAKLAEPARAVVAFTGDAGLEMVLGELVTLRDLALPVVVVVFVDASLALIELKQRGVGQDNLGVDFSETDFAALADALGGRGRLVGDRESLATEMEAALAADRFTVLACRIERAAYDGRL
ncbi:MAG: thiamine pyrophosphate-binding protein [Alphaproteobacteria bacterium]|jgi:acetolactate synthase-1/2/3 large subunit|nr:thiamine pyrophosphate-binding protein [Alphaproteobacteria bacterium]